MDTVFILQHEYEWCGRDEIKFIGVYTTQSDAEAALARLRDQPGFRDWPEGFLIEHYKLGVDHWQEGFVILVNILVPSITNPDVFQLAGSVWRPGDLYEISDIPEPSETKFRVGDVVKCTEQHVAGYGKSALVATEVIPEGD